MGPAGPGECRHDPQIRVRACVLICLDAYLLVRLYAYCLYAYILPLLLLYCVTVCLCVCVAIVRAMMIYLFCHYLSERLP